MSKTYNERSIPHRYRKGPDGGKRKSSYWKLRKFNFKKEYLWKITQVV